MNKTDDAIVKRIVKCLLIHQKEATSMQIVKHIENNGYGLRKIPQPNGLSKKIKIWAHENPWLKIKHYKNKKGVDVFYLKE